MLDTTTTTTTPSNFLLSDKTKKSFLNEKRRRVGKHVWSRLTDPTNTLALGLSTVAVFGIAAAEGWLRTARTLPWWARLRYTVAYARGQLLPSIIWLTSSPDDVDKRVLRSIKGAQWPSLLGTLSTRLRQRIFFLMVCRSVIFGFVGIANILRMMEIIGSADDTFASNVRRGKEPLMEIIDDSGGGRAIRLAGSSSLVTELSLNRQPVGTIVPVFEAKSGAEVEVLKQASNDGEFPVGWCVETNGAAGQGRYGDRRSWRGFQLTRRWLFERRQQGGNRSSPLLVLEADSSVSEQSMALTENCANDLTTAETASAFSFLTRMALEQGVIASADQVMRVLLLDRDTKVKSGGGTELTQAEFVRYRGEADVILDSKRPLVREVVSWVRKNCKSNTSVVVMDTNSSEYFESMRLNLAKEGISVLDRHDPRARQQEHLPVLVYQATSSDSVVAAESIVRSSNAPASSLCVLLDDAAAISELRAIPSLQSASHICSAVVFDDLFTKCRQLAQEGKSFADIQRDVDEGV